MNKEVAAWILLAAVPAAAHAAPVSNIENLHPSAVLRDIQDLPPAPAPAAVRPVSAPEPAKDADKSGLFDSAPVWDITPGVLCTPQDKDFAEYRYPERIAYCRRNTSKRDKMTVSEWYGVAWEDHGNYQYDHLLSLCLGGSNDLRNLWPMPWDEARAKAKLEFRLCERLRKGEVTQADAVREELGWFDDNVPRLLPRVIRLLKSTRPDLVPVERQ